MKKRIWPSKIRSVINGRKIYKKICDLFPNHKIYVCQHPGTGDVYIQCKYINAYAKMQGINNYVLVVVGSAAQKTTKLFEIEKVLKLSLNESNDLVLFYNFIGGVEKIEVLHYHPMMSHQSILGYARNFHNLNFLKMMGRYVFGNLEYKEMPEPSYASDTEYVDDLYKKYQLIDGKTILLAPYANSLNLLPYDFWEKLCKKLVKLGYSVVTNSTGKDELPIKGSAPVYIPYKYLKQFVTRGGASISFRSGLSDILSDIPHKKIVVYLKRDIWPIMGGLGTEYQYFSLKRMGTCDDVYEYELQSLIDKEQKRIINEIINVFID